MIRRAVDSSDTATVVFGTIASSADSTREALVGEHSADGTERFRRRGDGEGRAVELDIVRACIRDEENELVLVHVLRETSTTPRRSNCHATAPVVPRLPPCFVKACRTSEAVRFRLSVTASTSTATPSGP